MENIQLMRHANITDLNDEIKLYFKKLFLEHYTKLFYYGMKLSGSEEISRDCIQDMFLQFWSDSEKLKKVRWMKTYLFKCLRLRILTTLSKERKNRFQKDLLIIDSTIGSVEDAIIKSESEKFLNKKLSSELDALSSRQQEVLYLKYHLKYSNNEISEIMGIKYQSVRNLLSEAIKLLRVKFESEVA